MRPKETQGHQRHLKSLHHACLRRDFVHLPISRRCIELCDAVETCCRFVAACCESVKGVVLRTRPLAALARNLAERQSKSSSPEFELPSLGIFKAAQACVALVPGLLTTSRPQAQEKQHARPGDCSLEDIILYYIILYYIISHYTILYDMILYNNILKMLRKQRSRLGV